MTIFGEFGGPFKMGNFGHRKIIFGKWVQRDIYMSGRASSPIMISHIGGGGEGGLEKKL